MGSFYCNVTVRDRSQEQVLTALNANGVAALVSPAVGGVTVIYPSFEDEPAWQEPAAAAAMVSEWLGAAALAAMVHDSDILLLALAEGGVTIDEYNSCPSYFEDGEIAPPTGMDAAALVRLMGPGADAGAVEAILRKATPVMAGADGDEARRRTTPTSTTSRRSGTRTWCGRSSIRRWRLTSGPTTSCRMKCPTG